MLSIFECKLFRGDIKSNTWQSFRDVGVKIAISSIGITFRDQKSSILCDFPKSTIKCLCVTDANIFKIVMETHCTGSHLFGCSVSADQSTLFRSCLETNMYEIKYVKSSIEFEMPDINDSNVQQFALQLLFTDEFHEFVVAMSKFMLAIDEKVKYD